MAGTESALPVRKIWRFFAPQRDMPHLRRTNLSPGNLDRSKSQVLSGRVMTVKNSHGLIGRGGEGALDACTNVLPGMPLVPASRVEGNWEPLHETRSRPHFRDDRSTRWLCACVCGSCCPAVAAPAVGSAQQTLPGRSIRQPVAGTAQSLLLGRFHGGAESTPSCLIRVFALAHPGS